MKPLPNTLLLLIAMLTGTVTWAGDGSFLLVTFKGEFTTMIEQIYFVVSHDGR